MLTRHDPFVPRRVQLQQLANDTLTVPSHILKLGRENGIQWQDHTVRSGMWERTVRPDGLH